MARSDEDRARDATLLGRCLTGDRAAWGAFVDRFATLVYGAIHHALARHHVSSEAPLVDDLFGDVFLALWDRDLRKLRQWRGQCSLPSWIRLVATSVVVDHLRRRRPEEPLEPEDEQAGRLLEGLVDPAPHAQALLERAERIRHVRAAMECLSEDDRALLVRLYADGDKPGQVAEALGVRPGALYTRKNRALARLRKALEALSGEPGGL